jgi:phage terminase small subunit
MGSGGPRPGAGRRRKDPAMKRLAGTDRKDREIAIGEPAPVGVMVAPLHLSDLAQLHFASIAAMLEAEKRASPHYAEHVGLLALRLEQIQRYQAVLEMDGDTFTTESARAVGKGDNVRVVITKMVRARPEVAMLSDAMRQAQSLIGELMLNPAAALRIANGHKPEAGAFDDF